MKKELFEELLESAKQAIAIERGEMKPGRSFTVNRKNDVTRAKLGLSQQSLSCRRRHSHWPMTHDSPEMSELPPEVLEQCFPGGFTLRDEANAIVAWAFRNGPLEDLHAR